MLTQQFYNYLLNLNNSFDDTMSTDNSSMIGDLKELRIRTKTMNRREPALSHNLTLLIECGMVILVMTIVGLVFYCSQRNFKKRSTVHRRRWFDSDANIESYGDGQIYDTNAALEEYQPQPMDLDPDDCPPPYESVVQQTRISLNKHRNSAARHYQTCKNSPEELGKSLPNPQSNDRTELANNSDRNRNTSEPLIPPTGAVNSGISSLIESVSLASSSSPDRQSCYRDEECTIRREKDEFRVDVQSLKNSQAKYGKRTVEKFNIDPKKTVGCENEALLDASGLPSYDTALQIQECGNI